MSTKQKSKGLLVCCVFVCLAGLVGITPARGEASVLSRVRTIEDRELGELIRVALENLPETKRLAVWRPGTEAYNKAKEVEEIARLKTVRAVTEAYVQIKLLDSQIKQSDAKVGSSNLPEALARELVLARADLESQRATKLAELREIMHIVPRHALGRKPVKDLNGWLRLDIIGDSVLAFTCAKPFTEVEHKMRHVFVKLMTAKEAMSYAVSFVTDLAHHPVRVDILKRSIGAKFSEELEKELIRTIKRAKLELDAEVHLTESSRSGGVQHEYYFALRGKLGSRLERKQQQVVGSDGHTQVVDTEFHVRSPMSADQFDKDVRAWLVGKPERLPLKFRVKYDGQSKDLASQAEGIIRDIAKQLGVDKLVDVAQEQMDPDETK
ncbi:MAG: hypothetical protein PVJ86_06250 [Phycisphaerales bacterium]